MPSVELTRQSIETLICGASLLISPASTVVIQSIAAATPVVVMPAGNEWLGEMDDPMGAYEIARSRESAIAAARRAVAGRAQFRERSRRFFETHVSIEPGQPAAQRIASALAALATGGSA